MWIGVCDCGNRKYICEPINTDMTQTIKTISGGRKIQQTKYAPAFGAKAIFKMLKDAGFDVELKKANTNSWYIEVYQFYSSTNIRTAEIRFSDHSKPFNFDFERTKPGVHCNAYSAFDAEVLCSNSYAEVKAAVASWIALN